ncbi:MAG: Na+/H+ antiporter subunit E [Xanthomonadales bacterium]|nr:Na+/H+ antiporter subunit E [Xanthomonadales bacterium]
MDRPERPRESHPPPADRCRWGAQVVVVLMVAWLALDGTGNLFVGLAFAVAGALIGSLLVPGEVHRWRPLRLLGFLAWFVHASLRGGLDVLWRAASPSLPVSPGLHRHRLGLPPGLPRTVFLSVLSLVPGTLSVDLEEDAQVLVVHVLAAEAVVGVAALERRVAWLFSLPPLREDVS